MYPTMYLSKKSCIMLCIDLGRATERPLASYINQQLFRLILFEQHIDNYLN